MSRTYKVVVAGMGKRGKHHAAAFKKNPRFELAGLCDPVAAQLEKSAPDLGNPKTSTDAAALLKEVKPDLFCFCTPPSLRLPLIKLGIESGVKMIAYEKPMAPTMTEAIEIRKAVQASGVKTVVSHQHRYGEHYKKAHEIITSGSIGQLRTVYAHGVGWFAHLFTHMVDYLRWFNGNAEVEWVSGQAAGLGKITDIHPSPDWIVGVLHFANGVRGYIELGAGAPDVPEVDYWWRKNRLGAQGTEGFAECLTGGGWRAVTKNGLQSGGGCMNYDLDMPPYIQDMAAWLDDDKKVHPCNGESAYKGFEITMGVLRAIISRGQVKLPLGPGDTEIDELKKVLPNQPVLLSGEFQKKEYGPK